MKFTVLMSIYKGESGPFLKQSLDSILVHQSILPDEVVLVKDGMLTEELDNLLCKYSKLHNSLKVVGYEQNMGLGHALQFGLGFCSNELIFRMDGDDINRPYRFEKQLAIMEDDTIALTGGFIEEFNSTPGDLSQLRIVPLRPGLKDFKKRNPFNHMTVAFRKSLVQEAEGYESLLGYEDYYLWLKLFKLGMKTQNIDEVFVDARIGNNLMARRRGVALMKREVVFQMQAYKLKLWGRWTLCRNIVMRGGSRLLPSNIMMKIYRTLRK
jgi:glycosyltransferase involved in cell wall biosynthesis